MGSCESIIFCDSADTLYMDNLIEFEDESIKVSKLTSFK